MDSTMKANTPAMANTNAIVEKLRPALGIFAPNVSAISCMNAAIKKQNTSIKLHHTVRCANVKHISNTTAIRAMLITDFDLNIPF